MLDVKYKLIPAGFWLRLVAYGIDTALILGGGALIILTLVEIYGDQARLFGVALLPAYYLYYAILESSPARATLGKRLFGLRVVDLNGRRLGFWQALGRNLSKAASQFIFGIGFLMAAWTEKKQALHDKMAGTLVMKRVPVYIKRAE